MLAATAVLLVRRVALLRRTLLAGLAVAVASLAAGAASRSAVAVALGEVVREVFLKLVVVPANRHVQVS